jgi:hypothetical protein
MQPAAQRPLLRAPRKTAGSCARHPRSERVLVALTAGARGDRAYAMQATRTLGPLSTKHLRVVQNSAAEEVRPATIAHGNAAARARRAAQTHGSTRSRTATATTHAHNGGRAAPPFMPSSHPTSDPRPSCCWMPQARKPSARVGRRRRRPAARSHAMRCLSGQVRCRLVDRHGAMSLHTENRTCMRELAGGWSGPQWAAAEAAPSLAGRLNTPARECAGGQGADPSVNSIATLLLRAFDDYAYSSSSSRAFKYQQVVFL